MGETGCGEGDVSRLAEQAASRGSSGPPGGAGGERAIKAQNWQRARVSRFLAEEKNLHLSPVVRSSNFLGDDLKNKIEN